MSDMIEARELITTHERKDEERRKSLIIFGATKAAKHIRRVVSQEAKCPPNKTLFNRNLILELHQMIDTVSGYSGQLRQLDIISLGKTPLVAPTELPPRFHLYSLWLAEQMNLLKKSENSDNIKLALYTAAAAHYGLTMPEHHPFYNGNGRVARCLVNGILMSQTDELHIFKLYNVPFPVPLLRELPKEGNGYISTLTEIREKKTLIFFMAFLAQKWANSQKDILNNVERIANYTGYKGDQKLADTIRRRICRLESFAETGNESKIGNGRVWDHSQDALYPIPNYFDPFLLTSVYAKTI